MRYPAWRWMHFGMLLSLCAPVGAPCAEPAAAMPPVSDNAALQYWQAFGMLPAFDETQSEVIDNWAEAPLDDAVAKLLDQSQASLMYLRRGAKLRRCDWGLDYRDGIDMYLPHVAKARNLARVAALDARWAFDAGQRERAREDAIGMVALARHVGGDHTLVSMLVSYLIEEMAVDAAAPHLPELGASYEQAVSTFESLPPRPQLEQGVLCEKQFFHSIVRRLRQAEQRRPGSWRDVWNSMLGEEGADALEGVNTFSEVLQVMEGVQSAYDELAQLGKLPPREFDAKYPAFAGRVQASAPVAKLLLPSMEKVLSAQRRCEARMAMLLAGVAVVEGGAERLEGIQDPFGDGPFGYRELDNGFVLSSELLEDGKPVTLEIGRKATPATR